MCAPKSANLVRLCLKEFTSTTFSSIIERCIKITTKSIEQAIKTAQSIMQPLVEILLVWFLGKGGK